MALRAGGFGLAAALVGGFVLGCDDEPDSGPEGQVDEAAMPAPAAELTSADPVALGFSPDRLAAIDAYLQNLVDRGSLPGASLLILKRGEVAHVATVGWADIEHRSPVTQSSIFRLASATKIFVSVAFMTLVEEGRVSLSDPVSDYVPGFADVTGPDGASPPSSPITILDLLRHTAGQGYGYEDPFQTALVEAGLLVMGGVHGMDWSHDLTLDAWAERLVRVPLEDEPGTVFSYGLGHDVLGLVVQRVTGESLDRFIQRTVVEPLGLTGTGFRVPPARSGDLTSFYLFEDEVLRLVEAAAESPFHHVPRAPSGGGGWDQLGNGGMVSTLGDFAQLLEVLRNDGEANGNPLLGPETVALMKQNHLTGLADPTSFWPGVGFGLGYAYLFDPDAYPDAGSTGKIWWAGSTNVYFWIDPEEELTGVFMTHVLPFGHAEAMTAVDRMTYEALQPSG